MNIAKRVNEHTCYVASDVKRSFRVWFKKLSPQKIKFMVARVWPYVKYSSLSEILCVRHTMSPRNINAKQDTQP